MKELVIAPSILSLDYSRTSEQLKELDESNAKWMHFDVMDGHFVPNLTFGPDLLKGFKKAVDMVMDVHIMVDNPDMVAEIFAKAGADVITFHLEAVKDVDACIQLCRKIREMGVQAGVSVKPKTGVDALEKVRILRERIEKEGLNTRIEIDGGINGETAKLAVAAGVDTLVAGSYVFKNGIAESVDKLLACQR